MKIAALAILAVLPAIPLAEDVNLQGVDPATPFRKGYHQHDGFYLSMSLGPGLAGTTWLAGAGVVPHEQVFRGRGGTADFKIGAAISPSLILSLDLIGRSHADPKVEVDGYDAGTNDGWTFTERIVGVGLTYYFMPRNVFVSGTIGAGRLKLIVEDSDSWSDFRTESKSGLAVNVKVGKEWWVSKDWGLGIAGGFGLLRADGTQNYDDRWKTRQLYVLFNTTYD